MGNVASVALCGRPNRAYRCPRQAPPAREWPGPTAKVPLGTLFGARSGDKAGNATLGVWARTDEAYAWLRSWWRADRLHKLIPDSEGLELKTWELPLLRACGVTLRGFLGDGVAANLALDSQAKVSRNIFVPDMRRFLRSCSHQRNVTHDTFSGTPGTGPSRGRIRHRDNLA